MHATPRKLLLGSAFTLVPFLAVAAPLCAVQPTPADQPPATPPNTTVSYPASNESNGLTLIPGNRGRFPGGAVALRMLA